MTIFLGIVYFVILICSVATIIFNSVQAIKALIFIIKGNEQMFALKQMLINILPISIFSNLFMEKVTSINVFLSLFIIGTITLTTGLITQHNLNKLKEENKTNNESGK